MATIDASSLAGRKKLLANLRKPSGLLPNVQRLVTAVGEYPDQSLWLQSGLMAAVMDLVKSLPRELSHADAAAVCAAAAAMTLHLFECSPDLKTRDVVLQELIRDDDAWATLVNWGVLCDAAARPLTIDTSQLQLPIHADAPCSTDLYSARLVSLMVATAIVARLRAPDGSPHRALCNGEHNRYLLAIVTPEVVEDVLDYLLSCMSASVWNALASLAAADPQRMLRILPQLMPKLRGAMEMHAKALRIPRVVDERAAGVAIPLWMYNVLLERGTPLLPQLEGDVRWTLVAVGLDTALKALVAHPNAAVFEAGTGCCSRAVESLAIAVSKAGTRQAVQALLLQERRLCHWLRLLPQQGAIMQECIILLATCALDFGLDGPTPPEPAAAPSASTIEIAQQLLTYALDDICKAAQDQKLQVSMLYMLGLALGLSYKQQCAELLAGRTDFLEALVQVLPQLSPYLMWGASAASAMGAQRFVCCHVGLAFQLEQPTELLDSMQACFAAGLRKLAMADMLAPRSLELHFMELSTRPGSPASAYSPGQTMFPWLLAVGTCIEDGPPVRMEGCGITQEELWDFVAEVTRQRSNGQQLRRLYEGLKGRRQQLEGAQKLANAAGRKLLKDRVPGRSAVAQPSDMVGTRRNLLVALSCVPVRAHTSTMDEANFDLLLCYLGYHDRSTALAAASVLLRDLRCTLQQLLLAEEQCVQQSGSAHPTLSAAQLRALLSARAESFAKAQLAVKGWATSSETWDSQRWAELDVWLASCRILLHCGRAELLLRWQGWQELRRWSRLRPVEELRFAITAAAAEGAVTGVAGRDRQSHLSPSGRLQQLLLVLQTNETAGEQQRLPLARQWLQELTAASAGGGYGGALGASVSIAGGAGGPAEEGTGREGMKAARAQSKGELGGVGGAKQDARVRGDGPEGSSSSLLAPAAQAGSSSTGSSRATQQQLRAAEEVGGPVSLSLPAGDVRGACTAACAHCGSSGAQGKSLDRCSACRSVRYCSAKCQRAHWKVHRTLCRQLRGSGAGASSG